MTIVGTALGWVVVLLVTVLYTSAPPATLLLLAAVGLLIVSGLQSHRHRAVIDTRLAVNTRKLDYILSRLRQLDSATNPLPQKVARSTAKAVEGSTEKLRRAMVREITTAYHEVEALQNLYAMVPPQRRVPPMRGWAASPDLLLLIVELLRTDRPGLVVECGSGTSTLWSALAVRRFSLDTRVVALEHDPGYAQQTRDLLCAHGVDDVADVRLAPLEPLELAGETYRWYAREGWADLRDIGLLFVDGPPGKTGPLARYPALPLLGGRLTGDAAVVLDDVIRADEQEIVQRWLTESPGVWEQRLPLEKVASVLRRRQDSTRPWTTVPETPAPPVRQTPAPKTPMTPQAPQLAS